MVQRSLAQHGATQPRMHAHKDGIKSADVGEKWAGIKHFLDEETSM